MQTPLQITFRGMDASPALEEKIREAALDLDSVFDRLVSCRVAVEAPHHHHQQGNLFQVVIDLRVPGAHLVVDRSHAADPAHTDAHVAVRDAFRIAKRRLEEHARRHHGAALGHAARVG